MATTPTLNPKNNDTFYSRFEKDELRHKDDPILAPERNPKGKLDFTDKQVEQTSPEPKADKENSVPNNPKQVDEEQLDKDLTKIANNLKERLQKTTEEKSEVKTKSEQNEVTSKPLSPKDKTVSKQKVIQPSIITITDDDLTKIQKKVDKELRSRTSNKSLDSLLNTNKQELKAVSRKIDKLGKKNTNKLITARKQQIENDKTKKFKEKLEKLEFFEKLELLNKKEKLQENRNQLKSLKQPLNILRSAPGLELIQRSRNNGIKITLKDSVNADKRSFLDEAIKSQIDTIFGKEKPKENKQDSHPPKLPKKTPFPDQFQRFKEKIRELEEFTKNYVTLNNEDLKEIKSNLKEKDKEITRILKKQWIPKEEKKILTESLDLTQKPSKLLKQSPLVVKTTKTKNGINIQTSDEFKGKDSKDFIKELCSNTNIQNSLDNSASKPSKKPRKTNEAAKHARERTNITTTNITKER